MQRFIKDDNYETCLNQLSEIIDWGLTSTKVLDYRLKYNLSGKGIIVAIVDSGIGENLDLQNVSQRYNFYKDHNFNPHGTFCAGIVGAAANDIGVLGIAPESELHDIRILNTNGLCRWTILDEGLKRCLKLRPHIVNLSIGCPTVPPRTTVRLINELIDSGIIVIAAAGNAGIEKLDYPAALPKVIAVGSIDENNEKSSFSNYGINLTVKAPGGNVFSCLPNNEYGQGSGTSYASPFIAGICALILEKEGMPMDNIKMIEYLKRFKDVNGNINMAVQGEEICSRL